VILGTGSWPRTGPRRYAPRSGVNLLLLLDCCLMPARFMQGRGLDSLLAGSWTLRGLGDRSSNL
jgi:hypothetical protein